MEAAAPFRVGCVKKSDMFHRIGGLDLEQPLHKSLIVAYWSSETLYHTSSALLLALYDESNSQSKRRRVRLRKTKIRVEEHVQMVRAPGQIPWS